MNTLGVFCIAFLACFAFTEGLKCYQCSNCKDTMGEEKTCIAVLENTCMKVVANDIIVKRCGRKELCELKSEDRSTSDLWNNIVDKFGRDSAGKSTSLTCCDTDLCNSSTALQIPILLLLISAVIHAIMK